MKYIKLFIIFVLILGNFTFVSESSADPPFNSFDDFVLFAKEKITLERRVQVSSGNLGSNEKLYINKDSTINGNLFADKVNIYKRTVINGDLSFNKIRTGKEAEILGSTTTPVSLPIGDLPEIPDFQYGSQDIEFEGDGNTLPPGNYGEIELEENSRLTLSGGTYNLYKLELEKYATLVFDSPTTINIARKFSSHKNTFILPGSDTKPKDLLINYNSGKSIYLGKRSFLNFKLLAPEAKVYVGRETDYKGQILARKIRVGKDSILKNQEKFTRVTEPVSGVSLDVPSRLVPNIKEENVIFLRNPETVIPHPSYGFHFFDTPPGLSSLPHNEALEIIVRNKFGLGLIEIVGFEHNGVGVRTTGLTGGSFLLYNPEANKAVEITPAGLEDFDDPEFAQIVKSLEF